jgi:hypothetical protein
MNETRLPSFSPGFGRRMLRQPAWVQGMLLIAFCTVLALLLSVRTHSLTPASSDWNAPYSSQIHLYGGTSARLFSYRSFKLANRGPVSNQETSIRYLDRVQTLVFLVCTSVLLYYVLLAAGYPRVEAFLGIVMFWSYGAATKLLLASPYSPDPASFAISMAALYFLLKDHDVLLALTLAIGATVKETIVLIIPLVYTIRTKRVIDLRLFIRTALIGLPTLGVLLCIRHWIPAHNDVESYVSGAAAHPSPFGNIEV